MPVALPAEFPPDGPYPDYRALLRILLGLIDPELPDGTLVTEWWDEEEARVLVRITPRQAFRYTFQLVLSGTRVDVRGLVDGLNTFLLITNAPGRLAISADDPRCISYEVVEK
jgi:hypothetical protein